MLDEPHRSTPAEDAVRRVRGVSTKQCVLRGESGVDAEIVGQVKRQLHGAHVGDDQLGVAPERRPSWACAMAFAPAVSPCMESRKETQPS